MGNQTRDKCTICALRKHEFLFVAMYMMGENRANINANANELKWLLNAENFLIEFFLLFLWFCGACIWRKVTIQIVVSRCLKNSR